jgi:hypothetical protein
MALVGISEYTFMEFYAIREPYVRGLLVKRSLWILLLTTIIGTNSGTVVFFFMLTLCSCGVGMSLYFRPRQKTIVVVSASSSQRNSDGSSIHSHSSIRSHWRFQQVFLAGV